MRIASICHRKEFLNEQTFPFFALFSVSEKLEKS